LPRCYSQPHVSLGVQEPLESGAVGSNHRSRGTPAAGRDGGMGQSWLPLVDAAKISFGPFFGFLRFSLVLMIPDPTLQRLMTAVFPFLELAISSRTVNGSVLLSLDKILQIGA
jgi:hypothetical protein